MAPNPNPDTPKMPVAPKKGPGESPAIPGTPDVAKSEQTVRQLIEQAIAQLDSQAGLSAQETQLRDTTFKKIEGKLKDALSHRPGTPEKLHALQAQLAEVVEKARAGTTPRTDIEDLSITLAGVVHRMQIENKIRDITQKDPTLKEIETVGDIRRLTPEQLVQLEDAHEGILLYAFSDAADNNTQIDVENFYWKPVLGARLSIHFRGNDAAENTLGACDILPPSVRCITVYEKGNEQCARTSTRRIGLKGRNQDGTGFFDDKGYITIFTGDELVVGGADKKPDGIDLDFDKKYRGSDGKLNFDLFSKDHSEEESKFISGLKARGVSTSKEYTPAELQAIEERIQASGIRKNLVQAALSMIADKTPGDFCWDWMKKVYDRAGATFQEVYRGANYKNRQIQYIKDAAGKYVMENGKRKLNPKFDFNPQNPEDPSLINSLKPGDWYYNHNGNASDGASHSAMFLEWVDKSRLIARAVSQPRSGAGGRIHTVDFNRTPLVNLYKPLPMAGQSRLRTDTIA